MTADLTLPAVTAALVRAGVQTVVSVDEEPTMACPECGGIDSDMCGYESNGPAGWISGPCGCSGRVPLSGDVEIRANARGVEQIETGDLGNGCRLFRPHGLGPLTIGRSGNHPDGALYLPVTFDAPVARATVQCVPVVDREERFDFDRWPLSVDVICRHSDGTPVLWSDHGTHERDLSDQLPFLDLDAPWALVFSDVRPVEDR